MSLLSVVKLSYYSLISTARILKHNNLFSYNSLNKFLQKNKSSEKLRILGNGSSLNDFLNNFDTNASEYLVVNRHVLSSSYKIIKPKYYVLADPHFFFHQEGLNILSKINKDTEWNMIVFIPYSKKIKKTIAFYINNNLIQIKFFNHINFNGFNTIKHYLYKRNLSMPKVQNVLVASLYIGICAAYKTIELFGVEHSWTKHLTVNNFNDVCLENPHFYEGNKIETKTWKEIHNSEAKFHEVLRMYANMFESYWEIEKLAQLQNVRIINYTKNSFIDAFSRYGIH